MSSKKSLDKLSPHSERSVQEEEAEQDAGGSGQEEAQEQTPEHTPRGSEGRRTAPHTPGGSEGKPPLSRLVFH